jgi:NADPH:quinone reductase-like Zn-dependent oxidoreductase
MAAVETLDARQAERSSARTKRNLVMHHTRSDLHPMRSELTCTAWSEPSRLAVRRTDMPTPGPWQVLVRVEATSVNPIDVKRAAGYGRRLLGLKGAATLPVVLGNDVAGVVQEVGGGVSRFSKDQPVFGLVGTGRTPGAHASHVLVPQEQLVAASAPTSSSALAVLPYSFTTMWLAVMSTGLRPSNATGMNVLVNGANGGLGRLALHLLRTWGSRVTAICAQGTREDCVALGAARAVERGPGCIESLPADYHVVLNFGSWDDDPSLASRLAADACGQATTVHPLLANFDRFGWLRGALASRRDWTKVRSLVAKRAPQARYAWTVFKPDRRALDALDESVREHGLSLPVGLAVRFQDAGAAFEHVALGKAGRAVLLPGS